jgi:hypothetical protein
VGHLIPAGTGAREYRNAIVANKDAYQRMMAEKLAEQEIDE